MTLQDYLHMETIPRNLSDIVQAIADCCIQIGEKVERAAFDNHQGVVTSSSINSSGDERKKWM